ncbi:hypothetical protein FQN49_005661 [Arthroderma sp. PD_2]|nr:hypothetical protein FQN49_005661 [Arthroderma sp. PD_2]
MGGGSRTSPGYSYSWTQITIFVRWNMRTRQHLVYLLGCPEDMKEHFPSLLPRAETRTPYTIHLIFMREALRLYDISIWSLRDVVREIEKSRDSPTSASAGFNFPQLHDLARHIIHSTETLEVAIQTVKRITDEHARLQGNFRNDGENVLPTGPPSFEWERHELSFLHDELHALKMRSWSLNARLQNEINLAFNLISQLHGTSAQADSSVMKIIAIVSLVYLPGMFISSIFGMNFFVGTQGDQGLKITVSEDFWLYWSITIPLTATTLLVWAAWNFRVYITGLLGQTYGQSGSR